MPQWQIASATFSREQKPPTEPTNSCRTSKWNKHTKQKASWNQNSLAGIRVHCTPHVARMIPFKGGVYEAHGVLEKATAKNKGLLVRGIVLALMNDARARHQNVQNYPQAFRGAPAEARENASAVGRCRKNSANYGSYSNYSGDTFSLFRSDV